MEYKGNVIPDVVFNNIRRNLFHLENNPTYMSISFLDELRERVKVYEKEFQEKLYRREDSCKNFAIEFDSCEPYYNDDYPEQNTSGWMDINVVWDEMESDEEREWRIETEKKKIDLKIEREKRIEEKKEMDKIEESIEFLTSMGYTVLL